MNTETLLEALNAQCDNFRAQLHAASLAVDEFNKRLENILQQLHKNIEVRDNAFVEEFNLFCAQLRQQTNNTESFWLQARTDVRAFKNTDWSSDLVLAAKGFNSRARSLSRASDEFTTSYDRFCRNYKSFTAAKLNVWLLTSCQSDTDTLTGKILFLAREIAKQTEKNRGPYANG